MFFISNLCILCLRSYKDLKTILIKENEGIQIQNKLKYCLPEIVDSQVDIPEYICSECTSRIDCFYKFKQSCLRNNTHLKNYLQTLICTGETRKHLSVRISDIKYQNNPQEESHYQILPIVEDNDEIRTGENENNWTFEEADAVFENEIKYADLIDIEEAHLLSDDVKDIIVKEECLTFVDTSICDNKDVQEDSTYSSKIENISIEDTENHIINRTKTFQCGFCDKNYSNKILLEYHLKLHFTIKDFCCSVCGIQFISENELINHEKIHGNEGCTYSSKSNSISINAEENKDSRNQKIIKTKRLQCGFCDKDFLNKNLLEYHLKIHVGIKDFSCSPCGIEFISEDELINHEKIHTNIANNCATSEKNSNKEFNFDSIQSYSDISENKQKISTNASNSSENITTQREKKKVTVQRKKKQYQFKEFNSIRSDSDVSDNKNKQESSTHISNSSENVWTQHKENIVTVQCKVKKLKKYRCSICDKEYLHKRTLEHHLKGHAGIKDFSCSKCDKMFRLKRQLLDHEKQHTGIANFECLKCNKKFILRRHLIYHEKGHIGIKNFECSICSKKFLRKAHLQNHAIVHSDTKKYQCSVCNRKFLRKNHLRDHEQSHTGIKRFECSICKKKFMRKPDMIFHEKLHLGGDYVCRVCNKGFARKFNFKRHMECCHKKLISE